MNLAFSTLGCPNWTLEEAVGAAIANGYRALELRALAGSLDLLARPELSSGRAAETRARLGDFGLGVCCVDTSCSFDAADEGARRAQEDVALAHCDLASALGAPLIRVFPDRIPAGETREATRDRVAESLHRVAVRAPEGVHVGLETHGDFASAAATVELVRLADHPAIRVIWDVANALEGRTAVAEAATLLAPWLAHVHLRDARPVEGKEHWLPVLAGRGVVPFGEAVAALDAIGYDGYISFEWEKWWQPEIEEPEVAIPDFAAAMREILARDGAVRRRPGGAPR